LYSGTSSRAGFPSLSLLSLFYIVRTRRAGGSFRSVCFSEDLLTRCPIRGILSTVVSWAGICADRSAALSLWAGAVALTAVVPLARADSVVRRRRSTSQQGPARSRVDYLAEETLKRQPGHVQTYPLQATVFEQPARPRSAARDGLPDVSDSSPEERHLIPEGVRQWNSGCISRSYAKGCG